MRKVPEERKTAPFDETLIREFLLDNPDFFNRYPELLLAMRIPHAERGAISLVERKQEVYRNRVQQLEEEITSLLSMASRNEMIYMFNTALSLKLLKCEDLTELMHELEEGLKSQFHFSHVRLIAINDVDNKLSQFWNKRLYNGYYFGRLTIDESKKLFDVEVGSVALSRLSTQCGKMIFAIASQDSMHFHPEMDHLLLDQLKQLLDHLLPKL